MESNPRWGGGAWIFRGQNNVTCPLLPHAMRTSSLIDDYVEANFDEMFEHSLSDSRLAERIQGKFDQIWTEVFIAKGQVDNLGGLYGDLPTELFASDRNEIRRMQLLEDFKRNYVKSALHNNMEEFLVRAFVELSDRVGLPVPKDSFPTKWDRPFTYYDQIKSANLNLAMFSFFLATNLQALLMHWLGIMGFRLGYWIGPTGRKVAAFFAAHVGRPLGEEPEKMVVWAVKQKSLRNSYLRVVKHPRSELISSACMHRTACSLYNVGARSRSLLDQLVNGFPLKTYSHGIW